MGTSQTIDTNTHILVLFDGVCNLCNGSVQFVIRRDPTARFRFASLQSSVGHQQLVRHGIDPASMLSIVVIDHDVAYVKSDAALRIASHMPAGWPILGALRILPRFIRDRVYDFIAVRRYRWFGSTDSCMIPDPALANRFVG